MPHGQLQRTSDQPAPPAEKRAAYEKTFSIISIWPPAMAISGHRNSFCLILRRKDLALAHSHLQQVREAANKGSPEAMVALSQLYSNKRDKALYNMKQSARWAHFSSPCTLNMNYSWIWMLSISILSGNAGALHGTPHASLIPSCRGRSTPWCKVVYSPAHSATMPALNVGHSPTRRTGCGESDLSSEREHHV